LIRGDPTSPGRGHHDRRGTLRFQKLEGRLLIAQIELTTTDRHDFARNCREPPNNRGAHHPLMTRDKQW
jgi:hypothetical protein